MSRVELNFVATGNFSQLKTQLDQVKRSVEQLNKSSTGLGMNNDQVSRMKSMVAQYDKIVQSSGAFHRSVVQTQGVTERFGHSLQNQTLKLGQYFDAVKKGSSTTQGSLRQLAEQQVRLSQSIMRSDPFISGKVYVDTPKKINNISNATAIARKQQELYNLTLRNGANELIKWGKNTQWAGRQLSVGLTLPIMMFGKQASEVFIQFDKELVRMQKVYGSSLSAASSQATQQIRKDMTGLANDLASSYGQAIDMTAGIGADLAATGLEGKKLIDGTRETSRLATLGEIDRQAAVKTTIALQNVFKLSTKDLTESIDFLNAVENQSSLTLQDLTDAIPRAAPVVDELGGSYKDLAAMMAAMSEAGIPAAEAANAIKSSLASMINPTQETRDQLKGLGIDLVSIVNATGGKPVATFQLLAKEMKNLDQLSRARAIEQIFGKFQFARIAALLDNINTKGTQTARVFDLMGASSQQLAALSASELKALTESASGRYQRAMSSLQASLVPVGEKFTEVFTTLLEFFNKIFSFINQREGLLNVVTFLGLGIAAVGPIIMTAGTLFGNFLGFLSKGVITIKNLINGFGSFGKIATAETLAAANAAELFNEKMITEASTIDVVKLALQNLNKELMHLIVNQTKSAGISMSPAMAVQAQAAAQAASARMAGGGYANTVAGTSGATIKRDVVTTGIGGQFAHAVPRGTLEAAGLKSRDFAGPAVGVYTSGEASALQGKLNKFHVMETLLMTELQASEKRLSLYASQANISIEQAAMQFQGKEHVLAQLYPSVSTLKSTIVRFVTMLEFVDKKLQTATAEESVKIKEAVAMIKTGTVEGNGKLVSRGTNYLLNVAKQTAGGAQEFDAAMNKLVAQAVAKGNITDAMIMLATKNAQFTPRGSALSPLMTTHGSGNIGAAAAAHLGAMPMATDPSEVNSREALKQARLQLIQSIKNNKIAQDALTAEIQATKNAQGDARSKYILSTQEENAARKGTIDGLKKDQIVLEQAIINKRNYILALDGDTKTLYRLDATGKAVVVARQTEKGVIEAGIRNRLIAINAENVLRAEVIALGLSTQQATITLQEVAVSQKALFAPTKLLSKTLMDEGVSREQRVMLMNSINSSDIASTSEIIVLRDAEGNGILRLINSKNELIRHYDMASGKIAISNNMRNLETLAIKEKINGIHTEIANENKGLAKKTQQLAVLDRLSAVYTKGSQQEINIQQSQALLKIAIDDHTKKIMSLTATEAELEAARKREVISSTRRAQASIIRDLEEKLSSDALSLTKVQRSQMIKNMQYIEMASVEKVVVAQNDLGQKTVLFTNKVGETIVAYTLDEKGAMRRAAAGTLPITPVTNPTGKQPGKFATAISKPGVQGGAMAAGMGLSMAGGAMGNNFLMYGGMVLGMAPMLIQMFAEVALATFAAVAAGAAVIGVLIGAIYLIKKNIDDTRNMQSAYVEAFTMNSIAAEQFGLNLRDLSDSKLNDLVGKTDEASDSVNKLSEAYKNASDEITKNFIETLKNADPSTVTRMLLEKYKTAIIAGATDEQAKQEIAGILKAIGKEEMAFDITPKIDALALQGPLDAYQKRLTELTSKDVGQADRYGPDGTTNLIDPVKLENQMQLINAAIREGFSTLPIDQFKKASQAVFEDLSRFDALRMEGPVGKQIAAQFDMLVLDVEKTMPGIAAFMKDMATNSNASMSSIAAAAALAMNGIETDVVKLRRAAEDPVYMDFIVRTYQDTTALTTVSETVASSIVTPIGTGESASKPQEKDRVAELKAQFALEDKRKAEDEAIASRYDKLNAVQDKIIDKINKERDARNKLKEAQQANNEFLLTEMGLKKQIADARASGDEMTATLLEQQLQNEKDKKFADDKEQRTVAREDRKIKAAEKEKETIQKARDAEVKALEAVRKAEERAKQLADAAAEAAKKAGEAAKTQTALQTDAGVESTRVLGEIQKKIELVYFSTPESAMKDSLIAKLMKQLTDLGVPADIANQAVKDLWTSSSYGTFDTTMFDTLVTSLKGVASEAAIVTIVLDAQKLMLAHSGDKNYNSDTAISEAMRNWYGSARSVEEHQDMFLVIRESLQKAPAPRKAADGGQISGPGGPRDDKIPAMLSDGEYVIQADSVGHYGTGFFDAVNAKKFAGGGAAWAGYAKKFAGKVDYSGPNGSGVRNERDSSSPSSAAKPDDPTTWHYNGHKGGWGCSEFTWRILNKAGVMGGYQNSQGQYEMGSRVKKENLSAGDLVFYHKGNVFADGRGKNDPTHVAMYIGNEKVVGAAGSSSGTTISNAFSSGFLGARRLFTSSTRTPPSNARTTTPAAARTTTTPNPRPAPARAAGVIPFAALSAATSKMTSDFSPSATDITSAYGMGGMVMPKYHSGGKVGYAKGGEVAAILQSGETVLTTQLTDKLTPLLESIASGTMGMGDITNNIVINGANKSPEQIADIVMQKINSGISRHVRNNRVG